MANETASTPPARRTAKRSDASKNVGQREYLLVLFLSVTLVVNLFLVFGSGWRAYTTWSEVQEIEAEIQEHKQIIEARKQEEERRQLQENSRRRVP